MVTRLSNVDFQTKKEDFWRQISAQPIIYENKNTSVTSSRNFLSNYIYLDWTSRLINEYAKHTLAIKLSTGLEIITKRIKLVLKVLMFAGLTGTIYTMYNNSL